MPRQAGVAVENNFTKGLISEATGLNFPENACTDTDNCEFKFNGSVMRRPGFDLEDNSTTKIINRDNNVIRTYLWKNVAGNGNLTLLVVQVGATIYFYKTNQTSLSAGAVGTTITLTAVSGAPTPESVEAQFADGNGFLFVTHPYCEPMRVSYDSTTDTASKVDLILKIRDLEGDTADALAIDARPTTNLAGMDVHHTYNLYNQGWLTADLTTWDTAQTYMPSNADVDWRFKNSSGVFTATTAQINSVYSGNTPAPKGHFILTLSNQDRDAAAGTTGATSTTTGSQRPSTCAFFAGRVFYAGINYTGFNSNIYFTQIVERTPQYEYCYQTNDPTSEDLFDLLPSDGGVIRIPEAGTIYKLFTIPGGLAVFAANGVWYITGSTGIGFTANDYSEQKIAYIQTVSASSFVDVLGFPVWWNLDGIYTLTIGDNGSPVVKSLTDLTIKSFYDEIPDNSKRNARGFYHLIEKKIIWLYKSTDTTQINNVYEFDRILNFNLRTQAFYPWSITSSPVKVHGVAVTDANSGNVSVDNVIDGSSNNVVDGSTNQVIAFTTSGSVASPQFKFLVSYADAGSYKFTFAETKDDTLYKEWFQYDTIGQDFESFFITGYKLRTQALMDFQNNWIKVYSDATIPTSFQLQSVWDYALNDGTMRWSLPQTVTHTGSDYAVQSRRLKLRGHGTSYQFKVTSVSGQPFHVVGWSTMDLGNQVP